MAARLPSVAPPGGSKGDHPVDRLGHHRVVELASDGNPLRSPFGFDSLLPGAVAAETQRNAFLPAEIGKEFVVEQPDTFIHGENHDLMVFRRGRGGEPQNVLKMPIRVHQYTQFPRSCPFGWP